MAKVVYAFNKFYYDLIKDLKTAAAGLKPLIKKHYSVRNKDTRDNIDLFGASVDEDVIRCLVSSPQNDLFTFSQIGSVVLMTDTNLSDILLQITVEFKDKLVGYLYVLALLVVVDRHENRDAIFMAVMEAVNAVQKNEPYGALIDDIIDDDVHGLLDRIAANSTFRGSASASASGPAGPEEPFEAKMAGSKIGAIAKEIAQSIDLEGINIENPADLLNGSNSALIGDLVSKVGSKLQQSFQNGSVNQEDLMKEAVSMMGMFGGMGGGAGGAGGDFFANMVKSMAAGAGGFGQPSPTKARLQKKLEMRK